MMGNFIDDMEKKILEQLRTDCETLIYTAQEGSTLDKIWNGTYTTDDNQQ